MSLFDFTYNLTPLPPAPTPTSWAVPIGVVTAATIAGLFSLVTLIISKENKVTEFRQAWIDAQRNDLAEVLALAISLEVAPLEKRAENLVAFDRCFARILLRDNPLGSVSRDYRWKSRFRLRRPTRDNLKFWGLTKHKDKPLPWSSVTSNIGRLRAELFRANIDGDSVNRYKRLIVVASRRLLKSEWDIVKDGETWFTLTRHSVGSLVITGTVLLSISILATAIYHLLF